MRAYDASALRTWHYSVSYHRLEGVFTCFADSDRHVDDVLNLYISVTVVLPKYIKIPKII